MNTIQRILQDSKILQTDRLKIYPIKLETNILLDLWEIYSDYENVHRFSKKYSEIEDFAYVMMDKVNRHQNELFGYVGFVIEHKESGKIIGIRNIILDGVYNYQSKRMDNDDNVTVEIVINKKFWRNNYAYEASNEIFKHLAENGVKRVGAFLNNENNISINMCHKLGFKEVPEFKFINEYNFNKDHHILHSDITGPNLMLLELS